VIFCPSPASHDAIITIIIIIIIIIIIMMMIIMHLGFRVLTMPSSSSALSHDTCQGCLLRLCLWLTSSMVLLHIARHTSKQTREAGKIAAAWQLPQSGQFLA